MNVPNGWPPSGDEWKGNRDEHGPDCPMSPQERERMILYESALDYVRSHHDVKGINVNELAEKAYNFALDLRSRITGEDPAAIEARAWGKDR